LLDRSKDGIVSYGSAGLPTYGQSHYEPEKKTRILRCATHQVTHADLKAYTLEFSLLGTAAAFFVCSSDASQSQIRNSVSFNLRTQSISTTRQGAFPAGEEQVRNGILEMNSARGSLQDKLQEDLSEFEREYPW
jgi:hypothetical protein